MSKKKNGADHAYPAPIMALYAGAIIISLSGAALIVISVIRHISYPIMGNPVHGAVFGAIISFLGIRYFFSVKKLHRQIDSSGAFFSWKNILSKHQ